MNDKMESNNKQGRLKTIRSLAGAGADRDNPRTPEEINSHIRWLRDGDDVDMQSISPALSFSTSSDFEAAQKAILKDRAATRKFAEENPLELDFDKIVNREMTPEAKAEFDAEMAIYGEFLRWLNDNRRNFDHHDYRPVFDAVVDFAWQKHRFNITKISVIGTYTLETPPPCQPLELPLIRLEQGDIIADIVYSFRENHTWCLRHNHPSFDTAIVSRFLSRDPYRADGIEHLPPLVGQQTVYLLDQEEDLFAVLVLLLGKEA
jgi:hypothetical protein